MKEQELNRHWRGMEDNAPEAEQLATLRDEFPEGTVAPQARMNRRKFLALMGATSALAGAGAVGCRKPREYILPYAKRPEEIVPGHPLYFATSAFVGGKVLGLLVETQEGRPTKIDGNPLHPMSNPGTTLTSATLNPEHLPAGATDAWAQAAILDLYDPARSRHPRHNGRKSNWTAAWKALDDRFRSGGPTALLVESAPSPTREALLRNILASHSNVTLYFDDAALPLNQRAALSKSKAGDFNVVLHPDRANVLLALDADFLGTEGDTVWNSKLFAKGRLQESNKTMNRLYAVEATFSTTGTVADERLRMPSSQVGWFLMALCGRLGLGPAAASWNRWRRQLPKFGLSEKRVAAWLDALTKDLQANRGKSLIAVGARQPDWVHGLALWANQRLGNLGNIVGSRGASLPVSLVRDMPRATGNSLSALAASLRAGKVDTLVMLGGNVAYSAPRDLELAKLIGSVKTSIHLSDSVNETSKLVTWHLPQSHFLESWGDWRATDGTYSIQQPLIAPLFDSVDELTLLSRLGGRKLSAHALVLDHWSSTLRATSAGSWQKWLHDGVISTRDSHNYAALDLGWLAGAVLAARNPSPTGLEVNFVLDRSVYDGRFANNAWLQELPDTVTKVAWDNVAMISPATAKQLGLGDRMWNIEKGTATGFKAEVVNVRYKKRYLDIAVWITPGIADQTIVIPMGYHRKTGSDLFKEQIGFNANLIRTSAAPAFGWGATVSKMNERYQIVSTQHHGTMVEPHTGSIRPVVRDHTLKTYRSPNFKAVFSKPDVIPKAENRSLWEYPKPTGWATDGKQPQLGPQWGMVIDLNKCTGCNACTIACQSENNISVVGKQEVGRGREMHWIRVDRYFTGYEQVDGKKLEQEIHTEPKVALQPVMCQHCENAPCENVCPVGATLHSPEGLNDIAYNRCIGTRYCMNNCPYKVRRFNFYNFSARNDKEVPLIRLQRNPDVTVRFRGVVEKCSFCVQRIQRARIHAKVNPTGNFKNGQWAPKDGTVVSACQQACPSDAIAFGNINDRESAVFALKNRSPRNYDLLGDYNFKPRTSYLAKLRNPNPELKG